MLRNPRANRMKVLGTSQAAYAAAQTQLLAYLDAHDDQEAVDETPARAALVPPVSDRVWNELKREMGL